MTFWPFFRKKPQIQNGMYVPDAVRPGLRQYPGDASWPYWFNVSQNPVVQGAYYSPWVTESDEWKSSNGVFAIRSDGTLWRLHGHRPAWWPTLRTVEGIPDTFGPHQVGVDTDWDAIHGDMLLKEDGSLWAVETLDGDGIIHRAGTSYPSFGEGSEYYYRPEAHFRAILSTPIERVVFGGHPGVPYRAKPTVELRFSDDIAVGSGAEIECDWSGGITSVTVTDGGLGYTSPPQVVITPTTEGDSPAGTVLVAKLSNVGLSGFRVINPGKGYTYANAFDSITGATGTAIIARGEIVGWTLNSGGWAGRNFADDAAYLLNQSGVPTLSEVIITGNGSGAVAEGILAGASVASVEVSINPDAYQTKPTLHFVGGGGSGATATVDGLLGTVKGLTLTNPGEGYTSNVSLWAIPDPDAVEGEEDPYSQEQPVGSVVLVPTPVDRIVATSEGIFDEASDESDGIVLPFSKTIIFQDYTPPVESAKLVGNGGKEVSLSVTVSEATPTKDAEVTVSLDSQQSGWGDTPPVIRVFMKPADRTPLTAKEVVYAEWSDQCGNWPKKIKAKCEITGGSLGGNRFDGDVTVTGDLYGSSLNFYCVDGNLHQESCDIVTLQTVSQGDVENFIAGDYTATVDYGLFDGPISYSDHALPSQYFRPKSEAEEYTLYCCHPVIRPSYSVVATATISPVRDGSRCGYDSATLDEPGSGYVVEPTIVSDRLGPLYPKRIGNETWTSVSFVSQGAGELKAEYGYIGISQDGKAHWWGGAKPIRPTPIGRGVKIEVAGPIKGPVSGYRVATGFPQYGSTRASPAPTPVVTRPTSDTQSLVGKCSSESEVVSVTPHGIGIGYTSLPAVTFLQSGGESPLGGITASWVGPESFERVEGPVLIDSEGGCWDALTPSRWDSPSIVYSTTKTETITGRDKFATGNSPESVVTEYEYGQNFIHKTSRISLIDMRGANAPPEDGYATVTFSFESGAIIEVKPPSTDTSTTPDSCFTKFGSEIKYTSAVTAVTEWGVSAKDASTVEQQIYTLADGRLAPDALPLLAAPWFYPRSVSLPDVSVDYDGVSITLEHASDEPQLFQKLPMSVKSVSSIGLHYSEHYYFVLGEDGVVYWRHPSDGYFVIDPAVQEGVTSLVQNFSRNNKTGVIHELPSLVKADGGWHLDKPLMDTGRVSLAVSQIGHGYTEPPSLRIEQKPHVASVLAKIDGSVVAAAVIKGGTGFTVPPLLSVTANPMSGEDVSGSGAELEAVIEGPIASISVSKNGSGYFAPPDVSFSQPGISADAKASCSGTITAVRVVDGGVGLRWQPQIGFSGTGSGASAEASYTAYVDAVAVRNGGQDYDEEVEVLFTGGQGSGAEGFAVMRPDGRGRFSVDAIVVTNGGSGYKRRPSVSVQSRGSNRGSGAIAIATISGTITGVSVVNGGSGYTEDVAVICGDSAASLAADVSLSVDSVSVSYGGEYRQAPAVSFAPSGVVSSLWITDGGGGYSSPPVVGILSPCGEGATARCTIAASVSKITVRKSGSGYTKAPIIELVGGYDAASGEKATATAEVNEYGQIVSINVATSGSNYRTAPIVRVVPVEGGTGAVADATISGYVDSLSLIHKGSGYRTDCPVSVIFSGGGGGGAEATATVTEDGSGAQASAKINGQVIFCRVKSGGSEYQQSASVTVDMSDHEEFQQSLSLYNSGEITLAQHQETVDLCTPYIQTRVQGTISDLEIISAGDKYGGDITYSSSPLPPWAETDVKTDLGGKITNTTLTKEILSEPQFREKYASLSNSVDAITTISCRGGAYSVHKDSQPVAGGTAIRTPAEDRSVDRDSAVTVRQGSVRLHCEGSISLGPMFTLPGVVPPQDVLANGNLVPYDVQPAVQVEDVAGTGAEAIIDIGYLGLVTVTKGGSGYTLGATVRLSGGVPTCWGNTFPGGEAIIDESGKVLSVEFAGRWNGAFYGKVYLDGGGEDHGSIQPAGVAFSYGLVEIRFSPYPSLASRRFKSTPKVVVVSDPLPPDPRNGINDRARRLFRLHVENAKPVCAVREADKAENISSLSTYVFSFPQNRTWKVFPHYWDGWVDHSWISEDTRRWPGLPYSRIGDYQEGKTTLTAEYLGGGEGRDAACNAMILKWTDTYSEFLRNLQQE